MTQFHTFHRTGILYGPAGENTVAPGGQEMCSQWQYSIYPFVVMGNIFIETGIPRVNPVKTTVHITCEEAFLSGQVA